ncbi:M13 family metallopeptidase [Paraliomyxa miuraensis]|uniref:M13 family metallopeptidase n=1 Tax=Paraliomyxa miuraensis TaxID=376150 RepID=UPI00224CAB36|nr:M13 family metallopeptidase [Paraliomyxa miuraensis]MCX4245850.1 M13 family metallopeptidase [Paraliomyxa miuraensis]
MQTARGVGTVLWLGLGVAGCKVTDEPPLVDPVKVTEPVADPPPTSSIDSASSTQVLAIMDEAADPCADFYRYACGQWLDETPMPADQPRFGRFHELRDANKEAMRTILEKAAADPKAEGERAKLGRFYAACMDEGAASAAGLTGLQPLLAKIDAARTPAAFMTVVAELQQVGANPLFRVDVDPDFDDPTINVVHLLQGGLGLPDRSYYLDEGPQAEALRKAYVDHVALVLGTAGAPDAAKAAALVMTLETELARATVPRDQMRDPERQRNPLRRDALAKLTPGLVWDAWFSAAGRKDVSTLNLASPGYFEGMARAWAKAKAPARRAYLRWHLLHAIAQDLPAPIAAAHFELYDKRLQGQQEPTPRWRHCVEATDEVLGEVLGRQFVEQRFSGDSKAIAADMIARIEQAFADALPRLSWMDDATRQRALEKMHAIVNKVGYPAKWRDYGAVAVGSGHVANVLEGRRFEWQYRAAEIGQKVDPDHFGMTPPTVNAYYSPSRNEMVFPAGILQPPFFDAGRPMAMNFGGIGMVMGHELSHGFDDSGRKFDGEGRLTEWWGADVVERFEERAACVEAMYGGYEVQPGVPLNGKLTLGENIADLGGIRQAHGAYQAWAQQHGGDEAPMVEGLTNEQLLFVSYGQIWCTHATPEAERALVLTDTHSHARFRVNGPLSSFPAFWEAFSCEPGTPMHPANTCEVW